MMSLPSDREITDLDQAVQKYLAGKNPEEREKILQVGEEIAGYYAGIYSPGRSLDENLNRAASDGFTAALERFEPSRGVPFSTYATHCIISEIRDELRARNLFRVPKWLIRLQDDVIEATEELARKKSGLPTLKEIAARVNIVEQGIAETMQAGAVPMEEIDLSAIKNMRLETFKMPVEDVITIRKSLDRLSKIQNKVLSLISVNLSELSMAIEEEEKALTRTQVKHLRMVEGDAKQPGEVENSGSFKIAFPQEYDEDEILRYFEVLSDEYGLHLSEIRCVGRPKEVNNGSFKIPLDVRLEGRYRGLLELLDHLRKEEEAITVKKVRTSRSEQVPARISISINVDSFYQNEPPSGEK
jgi:RNA polymerase sigma-B factor